MEAVETFGYVFVTAGLIACVIVAALIYFDGRRVAREADARAYEAIRKAGCGPVSYRNLRQ